jgi:hypothetical protein
MRNEIETYNQIESDIELEERLRKSKEHQRQS